MTTKNELINELAQLGALSTLSTAYAEIAALRMAKSRTFVLKSRDFLDSLSQIFYDVLASYLTKKTEKAGKITFLTHNGKTVSVLISANVGLYGDIVGRTFDLFRQGYDLGGTEATIIGRLGLSLFREVYANSPYTYFDFPDNEVRVDLMEEIIRHLVSYEKIHLYYGKFQSVITQLPARSNISAEVIDLDVVSRRRPKEPKKYIFEPTPERLLMFFESQIFASLIDQTFRESQLAKFASRIRAMNTASENIGRKLREVEFRKLRFSHALENKKQLNFVSSLTHFI